MQAIKYVNKNEIQMKRSHYMWHHPLLGNKLPWQTSLHSWSIIRIKLPDNFYEAKVFFKLIKKGFQISNLTYLQAFMFGSQS